MSNSPLAWLPARSRVRILIALCLAVAIAIALAFLIGGAGGPASPASNETPVGIGFTRLNAAAPQFDLPLLQQKGQVELSKLAGLPIVLNLWASYCDICREESPAIAKVSREVGGKVRFLGIDTLDQRAAAIKFVQRYQLPFPIAYDSAGIVANKYRVPGLPVTFFISTTGTRILGVNIGALTAQRLVHILRQLYRVSA
jgi:cytochrome c biogenesis protein CcmG/thiol:disulfide interchange protein DsbE